MASIDRAVQDDLHRRVLAGDPVVRAEVFELLLDPLVDRLAFRWPRLRGTEQLGDQAIDAIMGYLGAPARYDPARSSLLTYLALDAHGDLLNSYRRSTLPTESLEVVELDPSRRKMLSVEPDHHPSDSGVLELLEQVRHALPDERDQRVVALMMNGERSTDLFAAALGIATLDGRAQREGVKRAKDRIKKRLARLMDSQ